MAIERELWIEMIKEGMVPDTSFLSHSVNMDEHVHANVLHLQEAGIDPEVLVDNDVWPIPVTTREDIPLELPLHTFDTVNTLVRNVEEMESSYNKMESVTRSHRNSLIKNISKHAAYNWCPSGDSEMTPVLVSNGAVNRFGLKRISFDDILEMQARFRSLDVNADSLVTVLNPFHLADLHAEDVKLYKEILASGKIFNSKLFTFSGLPYFDTTTGKKKAFGAATGTTDTQASLMYCETEVCLARGDTEVFARYKDPKERGDIIGFQQRAMALSFRGKYIGALYSGK